MSNFDYEKPIPANSLKPSTSKAKINFNKNLNYLIPFLKEIKEVHSGVMILILNGIIIFEI